MALESSRRELQLWFRPRLDQTLQSGDMSSQSSKTPTRDSFRTPTWSPGTKSHLGVGVAEQRREYYMGEGGGFPRVRAMVSLVCQNARGLSQHPRVFPNVN
jgi:hypothetical protein